MSDNAKQGIKVQIDADPDTETGIFRIGTADNILRLLADAHETEFTIPELVAATGAARSTVWRAVDLLDAIGSIRIRETPQRNYVTIGPDRLEKGDPILAISQSTFHAPIRAFVDTTETALTGADERGELLGVIVFGSVARGEADRRSDIDLFVVVDGDRTTARRSITDVVADLEAKRFDGERFAFEPYVETVESAQRAAGKLTEIVADGVTVYRSDELDGLKKAILTDE